MYSYNSQQGWRSHRASTSTAQNLSIWRHDPWSTWLDQQSSSSRWTKSCITAHPPSIGDSAWKEYCLEWLYPVGLPTRLLRNPLCSSSKPPYLEANQKGHPRFASRCRDWSRVMASRRWARRNKQESRINCLVRSTACELHSRPARGIWTTRVTCKK